MTAPVFDLAVLGGGPAGASCALAAARLGLRVALLEPQGAVFDKPCGEGLMACGVDALATLGLDALVGAARPFPGLRYVIGDAPPFELDFASPGRAIERPSLLAGLEHALAAERGVARFSAHASASPREGGFLVASSTGESIAAALLAVADGAGGREAPWLRGPLRARRSRRLGVRARCIGAERLERVEVHFGAGSEVYLTPLPDGLINVAVLCTPHPDGPRGAAGILADALLRHPRAARRLGAVRTQPSARALDRDAPRRVAGPRCFLVGDAAGAVDPILGAGLSLALATGLAAARGARALLDGADPRHVARTYRDLVRRETLARRRLAAVLRRIGDHPRVGLFAIALLRRSPRIVRALCAISEGSAGGARSSARTGGL